MSGTCVGAVAAAAAGATVMLGQLLVIVGGVSSEVDADADNDIDAGSGAGSCGAADDIAVVGGSVLIPVGTSVVTAASEAVVVAVVLTVSNGLTTVAESVLVRSVNVVRTGRGPRLVSMLGFKNGFNIDVVLLLSELLSSFPPEAIRSPGSRSEGLLFPGESLRDVVLEFEFETKVVVEVVDANGFVSVERPEDVFVLFSLLSGMKRSICAGESLFRRFWSRGIRRRTCFGLKPRDKTTSIDSCVCSPLMMTLAKDTWFFLSAALRNRSLEAIEVCVNVAFGGMAIAAPVGSAHVDGAKIDMRSPSTRTVAMVKDRAAGSWIFGTSPECRRKSPLIVRKRETKNESEVQHECDVRTRDGQRTQWLLDSVIGRGEASRISTHHLTRAQQLVGGCPMVRIRNVSYPVPGCGQQYQPYICHFSSDAPDTRVISVEAP